MVKIFGWKKAGESVRSNGLNMFAVAYKLNIYVIKVQHYPEWKNNSDAAKL